MSGRGGLRDVVAVESHVSAITGDGLTYRGIPIADLFARSHFEEVVFLLWFGRLPVAADLAAFRVRLTTAATLSDVSFDLLRIATPGGPALALETGIAGLALGEPSPADPLDRAVRLLAGLPAIVAAFDRLRRGLPPAPPADAQPHGSIAERFLATWHGREPAPIEVKTLDRSFVLVADHELNAATFAARVAASAGADLFSAVLAAVATQSGPLHGGATQFAGEILNASSPEGAAGDVVRRLDAGERIPGFGHPIYRRGDPRVPFFRLLVEEFAAQSGERRYLDAADRIAAIVADRKRLAPNMDLYAAACWGALGIPPDLFPAIFALGRMAGWVAHIREQVADNRLIRPRAHYAGPTNQRYVPIEERFS
jgi:citrate synthase